MIQEKIDTMNKFLKHRLFNENNLQELLIDLNISNLAENSIDIIDIENIADSLINGMNIIEDAWERMFSFKQRKLQELNNNIMIEEKTERERLDALDQLSKILFN